MSVTTVKMIRENLDDIPEHRFPTGYGHRWYRPGDERSWVDIHAKADQAIQYSLKQFEKEFAEARDRLHERQCYITGSDGTPVGTATAWLKKDSDGLENGLVHWVAIDPKTQGKRLAKPLMSIICRKFVEFGYSNARLVTDTARIPAIALYLKFGFVPEVHSEKEFSAWLEVMDKLGRSDLQAVITIA